MILHWEKSEEKTVKLENRLKGNYDYMKHHNVLSDY